MKRFFTSFFYAKGKPSPVYVWATIFCGLAVAMLIMRFIGRGEISDVLILGVLGFVVSWIALYNYQKTGGDNEH